MSTVIPDEAAAPSTAPETTPTATEQPPMSAYETELRSLTADQRLKWRETGLLPSEIEPKSGDQPPVAPPEPKKAAATKEAETETESAPADEGPKGKNRSNWAELRKKASRADQLEGQVELLQRQLEELRQGKPQKVEEAPVDGPPKRPRMKDFDDADKYDEAMDQWEEDTRAYGQRQSHQRESTQTAAQIESKWEESVTSAIKKNPDFEAVAFSDKTPGTDMMIRQAKMHKAGTDILYYLGKNPTEAAEIAEVTDLPDIEKIAKTNPARAAYLVGKAEALCEAAFDRIAKKIASPSVPRKPQLPKPTGEVSVTPEGSERLNADPVDDAIARGDVAAYKRLMNEREAKERLR